MLFDHQISLNFTHWEFKRERLPLCVSAVLQPAVLVFCYMSSAQLSSSTIEEAFLQLQSDCASRHKLPSWFGLLLRLFLLKC